jgi:hypothetical protein
MGNSSDQSDNGEIRDPADENFQRSLTQAKAAIPEDVAQMIGNGTQVDLNAGDPQGQVDYALAHNVMGYDSAFLAAGIANETAKAEEKPFNPNLIQLAEDAPKAVHKPETPGGFASLILGPSLGGKG